MGMYDYDPMVKAGDKPHDTDPAARKGSLGASVALLAAMGALLVFGGKNAQQEKAGELKIPGNVAGHVGQAALGGHEHQHHHPLPYYESDKGPDGHIDYFAHKFNQHGEVQQYRENRIDGGTPAPSPGN